MPPQMTRRPVGPNGAPERPGLYDRSFEHDACGIALVADLTASRPTVWSTRRSPRWSTWTTEAPKVQTRTRATARGSSFRSRTILRRRRAFRAAG